MIQLQIVPSGHECFLWPKTFTQRHDEWKEREKERTNDDDQQVLSALNHFSLSSCLPLSLSLAHLFRVSLPLSSSVSFSAAISLSTNHQWKSSTLALTHFLLVLIFFASSLLSQQLCEAIDLRLLKIGQFQFHSASPQGHTLQAVSVESVHLLCSSSSSPPLC